MTPVLLGVFVVALALTFSYTNGFHDSSSQVATVILSRALEPETALILAAIADFLGAYYLGTRVADTIGRGILDPDRIRASGIGVYVLSCALAGAISWNVITWYFGLPASSSHSLIGGLLGAFMAGWGPRPIHWGLVRDIVLVMLVSPLVGFAITYCFTKLTLFFSQWLGPKANRAFKGLQVASMVAQALAHGSNDAQKTMGVITFALVLLNLYRPAAGAALAVPHWVVALCSLTMAFGIVSGGWRIIKKLGSGLYRVRPVHAFAAQSASACIIYAASAFGFPVSTTQVISASVMGAGAAFRPKAVRWAVATDMVTAWMVTIPVSALLAAAAFWLVKMIFL